MTETDRRPHTWTGNSTDGWRCIDCPATIAPTATDRPGDRDQQQAASCVPGYGYYEGRCTQHGGRITRCDAAIATARAEEAARWRAKIEALEAGLRALVNHVGEQCDPWTGECSCPIGRARAVLDGER